MVGMRGTPGWGRRRRRDRLGSVGREVFGASPELGAALFGIPEGRAGRRWRRREARAAALALFAQQPMSGYQMLQDIAESSGRPRRRFRDRFVPRCAAWPMKN